MNAKEIVRAWQEANPREEHALAQGSEGWHAFRAKHFGASEAAAMMGVSPYLSRGELLRQKYAGAERAVSGELQKVFDRGHETEALARPLAEAMAGQELYPIVVSRGKLSASCDGLTMDDAIAFEHKQYEKDLSAAVQSGVLPDSHKPQCQQVLLVTDAERLLFVCSDGTEASFASVWVEPDYEYQAKLIASWKQFEADLATYQHAEVKPTLTAAPIDSLPALLVQVRGEVLSSNLVQFETVIAGRIAAINTDLQTDQDFADAEASVKFLKAGEDTLSLTEEQVIAQATSINEIIQSCTRLRELAKVKRLNLTRTIEARKVNLKEEIRGSGNSRYAEHVKTLNERLGRSLLTLQTQPPADFGAVMKGKRNFQAMRDAVDAELARVKIASNEIADRLQINLQHANAVATEHGFLFRDLDALLFKPADDFALIVKSRIADHQAAEQKRLDDDRAKIRAEEEAKAKAEAETKVRAEQAAAQPTPQPTPQPTAPTTVSTSPRNVVTMAPRARPSAADLIASVAAHFDVDESRALAWLLDTNFEAEVARRSSPQAA